MNGCGEEAGPESAGSDVNVLVFTPGCKEVEEFLTGMGGVPDDVVCSTQTSPVVKMCWEWLGVTHQ